MNLTGNPPKTRKLDDALIPFLSPTIQTQEGAW